MYLSRIMLHTAQLSSLRLLRLVDRGKYVMHQWLRQLSPDGQQRQFLYRRKALQSAFRFLTLSPQLPAESEIFEIQSHSSNPELRAGQRLCFSSRANPAICKTGKHHGLLVDAKRQVKEQIEPQDIWAYQQQTALVQLTRQGEQGRSSLAGIVMDAYRQ